MILLCFCRISVSLDIENSRISKLPIEERISVAAKSYPFALKKPTILIMPRTSNPSIDKRIASRKVIQMTWTTFSTTPRIVSNQLPPIVATSQTMKIINRIDPQPPPLSSETEYFLKQLCPDM